MKEAGVGEKPIMFHPGDKELDPLYFDLVGVIDINLLTKEGRIDEIMNFYKQGHPAKTNYKPALVENIGENIFAIFLATKELNQQSSRKLFSADALTEYRSAFPFIYKEAWHHQSFDVIKAGYLLASDLQSAVDEVNKMTKNSQGLKL